MAFEKNGEIREGLTPPENDDEKQASADRLEEHATRRFSVAAAASIAANRSKCKCGCDKGSKPE